MITRQYNDSHPAERCQKCYALFGENRISTQYAKGVLKDVYLCTEHATELAQDYTFEEIFWTDAQYTASDNPSAHIGYLRSGHFVCMSCNDHYEQEADAKVYLVNIAPYKQTCHDCGRLVVAGRTPAWCNAFD